MNQRPPRSRLFPYTTLFRSTLERYGTEGNTPVDVNLTLLSVTPSNTEPLKFRVNLAGPPAKPKYSLVTDRDRKSTRLNSSHGYISYAVFCLKKKTHRALRVG